jgi:transcriptional regulator with XRE-family HTH domain
MILRNLKAVRLDRALSMHELTRRSGVSTTTLVRAERGKEMYPATVRKLAKALGVTPAELRGDTTGTRPVSEPLPRRLRPAPPRITSEEVTHALAEAEWARREGDLAEAQRWEQVAAELVRA